MRRSSADVPPVQRTCRSGPRHRPRGRLPRTSRDVRVSEMSGSRDRRRGRRDKRRAADDRRAAMSASWVHRPGQRATNQGDPLMALTLTRSSKHDTGVPRQRGRRPCRRRHQGVRHAARPKSVRSTTSTSTSPPRRFTAIMGPSGSGKSHAHAHARRSRLAHERFGLDRRRRPRARSTTRSSRSFVVTASASSSRRSTSSRRSRRRRTSRCR